jgi:hypothetical protein
VNLQPIKIFHDADQAIRFPPDGRESHSLDRFCLLHVETITNNPINNYQLIIGFHWIVIIILLINCD